MTITVTDPSGDDIPSPEDKQLHPASDRPEGPPDDQGNWPLKRSQRYVKHLICVHLYTFKQVLVSFSFKLTRDFSLREDTNRSQYSDVFTLNM